MMLKTSQRQDQSLQKQKLGGGWGMFEPWDQDREQAKEDLLLDDDMPLEALTKSEVPPGDPNLLAKPIDPSADATEQHNCTHTNHSGPAPWCEHCIKGEGK